MSRLINGILCTSTRSERCSANFLSLIDQLHNSVVSKIKNTQFHSYDHSHAIQESSSDIFLYVLPSILKGYQSSWEFSVQIAAATMKLLSECERFLLFLSSDLFFSILSFPLIMARVEYCSILLLNIPWTVLIQRVLRYINLLFSIFANVAHTHCSHFDRFCFFLPIMSLCRWFPLFASS